MSNRKNKLLAEVLPLNIIREVEKWPVLYVPEFPERNNVFFKTKVWHEVAKNIFSDWDRFSKSQRHSKVIDLMKKWRNLRDTFKRQMELEKKISEGQNIKKKQYVYFKYMKFLAPHIQLSESREPVADAEAGPAAPAAALAAPATSRKRRVALDTTCSWQDDIDEDKHFALSLVSSFKKMTEDDKLSAKLKILKVIRDVRRRSSARVMPDSYSMPDAVQVDSLDPGIKVEFLELEDDNEISTDDDSN